MASEDATWDVEEYEATDDAQAQLSDEQADDSAQDSQVSGEVAESGAEDEDDADDGGDYDPESVAFDTAPQVVDKSASATPSQRPPSSKPKMSGGFLLEASDDEEDVQDGTPAAAPLARGQAAQADAVNNGASPAPPTAFPPNMPAAMANLDPVALFEARINEDPRGDMDAWLNLLADYKRRGRLDDLRSVYNRFVEVFPQAVSGWLGRHAASHALANNALSRRTYGSSGSS